MLLQGLEYGLPFYLLQRHAGQPGWRRGNDGVVGAQVLGVKVRGFEYGFPGDKNGAFYQVLQLADVAGVGQAGEELQGVGREVRAGQSVGFGLAVGKVACQQGNVFAAFAQGGQLDGDEVDAVEQVFAEGMFFYHVAQVGVGGRDDAHVYLAGAAVAQGLECLVLQHAQQLHLAGQVEVAYLVEEDGAPVGQFEAPRAVGGGVGEGAFLVAEHLALEQALGDAAQVDLDKRLPRPSAVEVYGFGYQLLARAALAGDEDRGVGGGYACHGVEHVGQPARLADDVAAVQHRRAVSLVLYRWGGKGEGGLDALQQGGVVPGLGDEVEGTCLHALHGQLDAAPGGHEYDGHLGAEHFDLPQQGEAFFAGGGEGEVHVHQYQVRRLRAHGVYGLAGAGHGLYVVACALQHEAQR